jgi:HSP20 family molecular chaperone IbpA
MNHKMLFIAIALSACCLHGRHYESFFSSQWESTLPEFSLEKSDSSVLITVDTGKKVTADDIAINHKDNRVSVNIKGLEHTLTLKIESSKHTLGISMCSQAHQEKKSDHGFSEYQGSSCMQQVMSVAVDLADITAEYSGTKLILSVPLIKEAQGKKISVVMKDTEDSARAPSIPNPSTTLRVNGVEKRINAQGERLDEK